YFRLGSTRFDRASSILSSLVWLWASWIIFECQLSDAWHPPNVFHFNPLMHPLAAMIGHRPIGDELLSLYGFFPVYLAPFLRLFEPSIEAATALFSAVATLALWAVFITTVLVIKHPVVRFVTAVAATAWYRMAPWAILSPEGN